MSKDRRNPDELTAKQIAAKKQRRIDKAKNAAAFNKPPTAQMSHGSSTKAEKKRRDAAGGEIQPR